MAMFFLFCFTIENYINRLCNGIHTLLVMCQVLNRPHLLELNPEASGYDIFSANTVTAGRTV